MKIRGDFVTNSSSVSYILTMKEEVFDINVATSRDKGIGQFFSFVGNKIKNEGDRVVLNGEELYSLKLTFDTDEASPLDGISDDDYDFEGFYNVLYDLDINTLSDKELTSFLYWTILYPNYISNIGATKVETY